jgi:pimeloyl-ACP methyl ester carboxylesterase
MNLRISILLVLALCVSATAAARQPCTSDTRSQPIDQAAVVYNSFGSGPALLLLHGLFADKEQWTPLGCLLAQTGRKVVVPDLPGYGQSVGFGLSAYRLEEQVRLLHELTRRLGIERLDVAGNSLGGAVAELFAKSYPEEVRTVAFLGAPFGYAPWAEPVRQAIFSGINPFIPTTDTELDEELALLFMHPPVLAAERRHALLAGYLTNKQYVQAWNIVNVYAGVLTQMKLAQKPTFIVWGLEDRVFGVVAARDLQRQVAGSELHELHGAGHLLHLENATEIAPMYARFLAAAAKDNSTSHAATGARAWVEASFVCSSGERIEARFDTRRNRVDLVLSGGRRLSLPQAISASGARYANADESIVFWNKGTAAFMQENGVVTQSDCRAVSR